MLLRILDTQIHVKDMKHICELRHVLVPSLPQHGPLYVFIFIAPDRVIWFLDGTVEIIPSGCS